MASEVSAQIPIAERPHAVERERRMQHWAQSWSEQLRRDALNSSAPNRAARRAKA
jgi:hypothetical protein